MEDENENELIPRFSLTTPIPSTRRSKLTTKPIEKAKTTRKSFASRPSITSQTKKSTTSSPVSSEPLHNKQHRFHAKIKARNDTKPAFAGKIYNSPRGVYSSRSVKQNEKEPNTSETVVSSTPVPKTLKKPTRYSSKYRNDISSRTATPKSTTNAPFYIPTIPTAAYIPTVPTVNPPATTVNFQEGTKDKDLGLEVFMFDDPVNTIHSANLVNGELLTRNKVLNIAALVKEQTTEKPVSIIERIINSITAISTTTAPNISTSSVDDVKSTTEASSAILKLATKKSTRLDKTKPDKPDEKTTNPLVSSTSEKPTTIIEKILSSLNAIQNNETNTEQVGNDFNTISYQPTTAMSRVVKYSSTYKALPAQASTSINPLRVFNEIGDEQVLQKRTIGKLLQILNGLTSTNPPELVAITPKNSISVTGSPKQEKISVDPTPYESSTTTEMSISTVSVDSPSANPLSISESTGTDESTTFPSLSTSEQPFITTTVIPSTTTQDISTTEVTMSSSSEILTTEATTRSVFKLIPLRADTEEDLTRERYTTLVHSEEQPLFTSSLLDSTGTEASTPSSNIFSTSPELFTIPSGIPELSLFEVDSNRMARVQSISDALQTKAAVTVSTSTTQSSVSSTALPSTTVATSTTLPTTAETTTNSPTKSSTVTSIPPLTTLSGLLSGKIVESSTELTTNPIPTANYQTLNVNQYNEVLNIQDILNLNRVNKDVVFRWKPVSRPDTTDNHQNTKTVASSTTSTTKPTTLLFTSAPSVSEGTTTAVPRPTVTATNPITRPTTTPSPPTTTSSFPTAFKSMPRYTNTPTTISRTETSTGAPLSTYIPSTTLQPATTFLPALLSTLFPNILRVTSENPFRTYNEFYSESVTPSTERFVTASTSRVTTVVPLTTTEKETTTTQTTTTTTTAATTITTTTTIAPSTTVSTTTTTEAPRTTTTIPLTTVEYVQRSTKRSTETSNSPPVDSKAEYKEAKKLKALTEQQRKDLEEIAKLEKEQAALLQQLSFLTNFVGGPRNTNKPVTPSSLANRIIAMAVEKESSKSTTKKPNSIQDKLEALDSTTKAPSKKSSPSLEDVLKQYNINNLNVTPATLSSTYGTSNDAILASLLKNQGIGPTTPKTLREQLKQSNFVETTTTKEPKPKTKSRPRTTTQRPTSRLMQGLNWLINAFSDPTTSRPPVRRPTKSKKPPVDQELLTNQPTRITPVVTAAPKTLPKSLSQEEIRDLIKQLEEIQKDPKNRDQLDFSKIKSIQNLIEGTDGVEISHSGEHGATSRVTTRLPKTTKIVATKEKQRSIRTTTNRNPTESNNIEDDTDFEPTTAKQRPSLPPLRLRPIPGIDDGNNNSDPLIRGNLITAAVNVTRAISSFLGSALQGAAQSFQSLIGSGSSVVGNISQGSSSSRPS